MEGNLERRTQKDITVDPMNPAEAPMNRDKHNCESENPFRRILANSKAMPTNNPPAIDAKQPKSDTAPFVPLGTLFNSSTLPSLIPNNNKGCTAPMTTPNSEAQVSPLQQA